MTQGVDDILASGIAPAAVSWFPEEPPFTFLADPFGWKDGDLLHVFAEHYDYRERHGRIERLTFDSQGTLAERRPCLSEPWHLSYPFVFAGEGAMWMMPEAHRSGCLTLYRAHADLADWRGECKIELDCVPVDASICRHEGRWWLFYAPATGKAAKVGRLHIAWAESLCGPWTPHPANPVRVGRSSARPGGTPVCVDGRIMLPVQDCSGTYGGAIRPLWIEKINEEGFAAHAGDALSIPASAGRFCDGMHTLSSCGDITLIDAKRIDRSLTGLVLDVRRILGGYAAR